jgi:hypothetical protein
MKKSVYIKHPICEEILDALGIENCRSFALKMEVGQPVTVEVEYFPDEDSISRLIPVFRKYALVRRIFSLKKYALVRRG